MSTAVNLNTPSKGSKKTDFLANARAAWGAALPDWVEVLAEAANAHTATEVARRIAYSTAVVSSVCSGKYAGDLGRVEAKVRGVFMGDVVACPVLDEIPRDVCLAEQKKRFFGTSSIRTKLYRACPACAHSRQRQKEAAHG